MTCSYLVQVLVDVVAGDGRVGHKVEEFSDRHHCHAAFHKEVWMQTQEAVLESRRKGKCLQGHKSAGLGLFVSLCSVRSSH